MSFPMQAHALFLYTITKDVITDVSRYGKKMAAEEKIERTEQAVSWLCQSVGLDFSAGEILKIIYAINKVNYLTGRKKKG